jgi:hypothetical protein
MSGSNDSVAPAANPWTTLAARWLSSDWVNAAPIEAAVNTTAHVINIGLRPTHNPAGNIRKFPECERI